MNAGAIGKNPLNDRVVLLVLISLAVIASSHNSSAGFFAATGDLNYEHSFHTATLLTNGKVLVAGGANDNGTAEIYDPVLGTWAITGSPGVGRGFHTATLLQNGEVLITGGGNSSGTLSSAEIYN